MALCNCPDCGAAMSSATSACPHCGCTERVAAPSPRRFITCQGTGIQKASLTEMIKLFNHPIDNDSFLRLDEKERQKREAAGWRQAEARARQLHTFDEHDMTEFECVVCQGRGTVAN